MRWFITAVVIATLAMWGGFAGAAQAQVAGPAIQTQGTLTSVSVDALTFSVIGPAGTQAFHVTSVTAFYAGTERIGFDRLSEFIGAVALVRSAPIESEQIAGIVTLLVYPVSGTVSGFGPDTTELGGGPAIGGGNNGGGPPGPPEPPGPPGGHGHGEGGNSGKADNNDHGQGSERNQGRDH